VNSTLRLLRPHLFRYAPTLVLGALLGAVSAFGQRSIILLAYPALDVLFPKGAHAGAATVPRVGVQAKLAELGRGFRDWLVGDPVTSADKLAACGRIALVLGIAAVFAAVTQYSFILIARGVAVRMVVDLRMRIARHLMSLSMAYHGRRHFGDLLSRLSSDVTTTLNVLNQSLKDLVQEPLFALISLSIAAWIAPIPTLVVILGLVVVGVTMLRNLRRVRRGSSKSLSTLGTSVQALSQMFQGIRAVKAFRAEERELESYREINEQYVRSSMKMVRAHARVQASTFLFSYLGMAGLIVLIGWLTVKAGAFRDEKDMLVFLLSVSQVYGNVKDISRAVTQVQESVGASERIQALLDEKPDLVEKPGARVVAGLGTGLRLERISFSYPQGDGPALEDLDLEIRRGETLALVGPSGSGKSTLVDLVARFIDPSRGRVTVDGIDLRDATLDSWAAQYAMVGQTPFLFHTSIEENIRYGKPDATREEIVVAARAAGIHDFIAALPQGYETNVADAGSRLSGGQRQRITIARAFLKGAPLLLLDEATSALDTESEKVVQEALERLMSHRTVVVIAHRLSTVRKADRIAVLDRGRLVELGSHGELLARGGLYARLYAGQELPDDAPRGAPAEEPDESPSEAAIT